MSQEPKIKNKMTKNQETFKPKTKNQNGEPKTKVERRQGYVEEAYAVSERK